MKFQIVTPYRVNHLQRYGVTVRSNVTSVYPPYYAVSTSVIRILKTFLWLSISLEYMTQHATRYL
jgi:hypothetical protein